jgi:L-aminopeptidase/D-esterase-like protein
MGTPDGWRTGPRDAITDVPGVHVGHWTDRRGGTGCTVVRCEKALVAAADTRGGAPGTQEIDLLGPAMLAQNCHAVLLTGGSAFGLAAAAGVVRWLSEHGFGFPTRLRKVPVVPAAVLFDLGLGRADAFPDQHAGYLAAGRATRGRVAQGSVGAGTGATVAKLLGDQRHLKGGVGTASVAGPRGLLVGAIAACNALGHIYDPESGELVAGPRDEGGRMVGLARATGERQPANPFMENTTLVCVATNAALEHRQLQRLAFQAHDGLARVVVPAHTFADGDVAFAISMGPVEPHPDDATTLGAMTVRAVERALLNAVRLATGLHGVPSAREWSA